MLGTGSMDTLLAGKHYNRGVRCHKLVFEALQRLKLLAFKEWCESAGKTWNQHALVQATSEFCSGLSFNSRTSLEGLPAMPKLFRDYQEFCSQFTSSMAQFWKSHMVSLLRFIKATREGDWTLHLQCVREMTCNRQLRMN